jgi:hypothetical protein
MITFADCCVSEHTVKAIEKAETASIAERKEELLHKALRIASKRLTASKIKSTALTSLKPQSRSESLQRKRCCSAAVPRYTALITTLTPRASI